VSRVATPGDDAGADAPFACSVHAERERVRLSLVGELDVATVPEVRGHLAELVDAGFTHVVVDLREVRFIDSTGLSAILASRAAMDRCGRKLSVWPGPPEVRRIFEITGTDRLLVDGQDGRA
jgi:anti-anti-sigma factor